MESRTKLHVGLRSSVPVMNSKQYLAHAKQFIHIVNPALALEGKFRKEFEKET